MKIIDIFKKIHIHRYKTLRVYKPHNQSCDLPQCKNNDEYGFVLYCDCGKTKLPKLPYGINKILNMYTN